VINGSLGDRGKNMSRIRVVLADDHPVIRSYLRDVLQKAPDINVIGEASDGRQMVKMACDLEPDVVLLDIEMPGLNGVETTNKLHEEGLDVPILVISSHNDIHLITALFQIGIAGYVNKDEALSEVVPAVRAVAEGRSGWLSHQLATSMPAPTREEIASTNIQPESLSGQGARVYAYETRMGN
jgi:DNA-binding NarL/FixJ family response regulator